VYAFYDSLWLAAAVHADPRNKQEEEAKGKGKGKGRVLTIALLT